MFCSGDYAMTISGYAKFIERLMVNSVAANKGRPALLAANSKHGVLGHSPATTSTLLFFKSLWQSYVNVEHNCVRVDGEVTVSHINPAFWRLLQ